MSMTATTHLLSSYERSSKNCHFMTLCLTSVMMHYMSFRLWPGKSSCLHFLLIALLLYYYRLLSNLLHLNKTGWIIWVLKILKCTNSWKLAQGVGTLGQWRWSAGRPLPNCHWVIYANTSVLTSLTVGVNLWSQTQTQKGGSNVLSVVQMIASKTQCMNVEHVKSQCVGRH